MKFDEVPKMGEHLLLEYGQLSSIDLANEATVESIFSELL
jgi:hypothetical protein